MEPNLKNARILIVDDQAVNVEVLEGLLMANGYFNIKTTTDSRKAVELVKQFNPDILLLDLMMPHVSGFEVMENLRSDDSLHRFMPILVLTADATKESKQKALSNGANDFLTKPFDFDETQLRIKNLLLMNYLMTQLKDQNIILENKVKERTHELEELNKELTVAKNKAEEINKLKSFFLSNISHEFRTPLISILGFAEILVSELENPDHINYSKYIYESGQRLQKTLNDILSLTEIEKKKIESKPERYDLSKFLIGFSDDYKKRVEDKGLKFEKKIESNEVWLLTDVNLLKSVLDNILDNSLKFTKKGGILIGLKHLSNEIPHAVISIVDTGVGIAPEKIEQIFTPFRQESEGMSRSFEGMGLGLAVAKQLVEILHGEISIKSEVGKGTIVNIKLPIIQSEQEVADKIKQVKSLIPELPKSQPANKPQLLMVEDNAGNRTLFSRILSTDFIVEEAVDGVTAIAMAELKKYDIILMDINLGPGIDGIETFNRIKQLPNFNNTPVIACTAFAMKEDRQKFIGHGFNDYIQKPVLKEDFLSLIKSHVK